MKTQKKAQKEQQQKVSPAITSFLPTDRVVPPPEALVRLSLPLSLEIVATDISRDGNEGA